jgi:hypothetical protein
MAKGKKNCPNCKIELGARTELCDCGWYYPEGKIRQDLMAKKKNKAEMKQASSSSSSVRRGIRKCVNCGAEIGYRTHLCDCGWYYPEGKIRQDLLLERTAKAEKKQQCSSTKGKRKCINCGAEIGYRTHLCDCGWYYPENKLRMDLLKDKQDKSSSAQMYYDTVGRGKKKCPGCNKIVGGRLETCYCGFDFVSAKGEKDKVTEQRKIEKQQKRDDAPSTKEISPQTAKILAGLTPFTASPTLTKREHAERVLGYGKERAAILLQQARLEKCWSHVDWDYVEQKLTG